MKIQFFCPSCNYYFTKTKEELIEEKQSFRYCALCGEKLKVINLKDAITQDTLEQIERYVMQWLNEQGIEGTIEMLERQKYLPYIELYFDVLRKKGIYK